MEKEGRMDVDNEEGRGTLLARKRKKRNKNPLSDEGKQSRKLQLDYCTV